MTAFTIIIPVFLFILGLIGTFLPVMPGVLLIWIGMFIYGILTEFQELTATFFLIQGLAALLVLLIDYIASAWGVQKFGGSRIAMLSAVVGLFIGVLFFNIPGFIFGPFLGALIAELVRGLPIDKAILSGLGTLIGLLGGILLKLIIEIIMIIWFFIAI
ncbi:DUF456 domain-containing protein [Natranaerobius trueperi]|uniref:DUF456 domain-containing protein n=1 Tax=Natranaerobius trueperi TaxID=759412 RepID=A0A226BZD6_9FIRM|nr:DUF456 domain-containing protein [Natranaerobius trueperi]OWZ84393.1 hypothetical protein CDO51_03780 [Natranaerobius trueperi]